MTGFYYFIQKKLSWLVDIDDMFLKWRMGYTYG